MARLRESILRFAKFRSVPILIQGPSGAGKELVAKAVHELSGVKGPLIAVNRGAVVETLVESELFGNCKGAFTGADGKRQGFLSAAADGTLFLDEIGDMPPALQAKLLRVLEAKEYFAVGGCSPLTFRARVVAATHRNLADMVRQGTFRGDLYSRLAFAIVRVPPLSERLEDIDELAAARPRA